MSRFTASTLILLTYSFSHFFLILNYDGLYWDDWVSYSQSDLTLDIFFNEIQHGIKGDFFKIISSLGNGIFPFRIFVFIAYPIISFFIFKILLSIKGVEKHDAFIVSLVFLLFPLPEVKISTSINPFIFPVFLFYFAFYIASQFNVKNPPIRVLTLALFLASFSTNAIIFLYGVFIIYLWSLEYDSTTFSMRKFIKKYFDFILLPIIYSTLKLTIFIPSGLYSGYNSIKNTEILSFLNFIYNTTKEITYNIFSELSGILATTSSAFLIILSIGVLTAIFGSIQKKRMIPFTSINLIFLGIGLVSFTLALFPYWLAGKAPTIRSWDSRFLLLTPLGFSLMLIYGGKLLKITHKQYGEKINHLIITFFIIGFSLINFNAYKSYLIDWFFQSSIKENFLLNQEIRDNDTFIIINEASSFMANERSFNYYEWTGLLKYSFQDTKRLMISPPLNSMTIDSYRGMNYKQYNYFEWNGNNLPLCVVINKDKNINTFGFYFLLYKYLTNKKEFLSISKSLTKLHVYQITNHICQK